MSTAKVTAALLLRVNAETEWLSIIDMNMETANSLPVRVSRFFSDRYAYRTQPEYLSELVAFGMIQPNGESPKCDSYEARLMKTLDVLKGQRPSISYDCDRLK